MAPRPNKIPDGWATAPLGDLGLWVGGSTPSRSNPRYWKNGNIPWVSPKDMKSDAICGTLDCITGEAVDETLISLVPVHSLLFVTRSGILKHSLPVAFNTVPVTINQDIKALTLHAGVDYKFIRYQVAARQTEILRSVVKSGATVESVDFASLKNFPLLIPSLPEQRAIAERLDELTGLIKDTRLSLERAKAKLTLSLKIALQAAFDGRLAHTGSTRENWGTARIREIVASISAGKSMRCRERPPEENEKGVIKVSAVSWGRFDPSQSKTLPDTYEPSLNALIREGDFLFSRSNTRELVGACVIVENAPDNLYLSDKTLRLQMPDQWKKWLLWYLRSPDGRRKLQSMARGSQQSMLNISQDSVLSCDIPVPDEITRNSTIKAIEGLSDASQVATADLDNALLRLTDIERQIYRLAFSGALSSGDGHYPAATELIAQLRVAKSSPANRPRRPRKLGHQMNQIPVREQILSAIRRSPQNKMSFDDLRRSVSSDYETLQNELFALLTSESPIVKQIFDEENQRIMLMVNAP